MLYGDARTGGTHGIGGLNAMFVLTAPPETFNLPAAPELPQDRVAPAFRSVAVAAVGIALGVVVALRRGR